MLITKRNKGITITIINQKAISNKKMEGAKHKNDK